MVPLQFSSIISSEREPFGIRSGFYGPDAISAVLGIDYYITILLHPMQLKTTEKM